MPTGSICPLTACSAFLDESLGLRHHARDGAVEPHGRVDGMRQQIARHAAAGDFDVQPPERVAALRDVGGNGPVLQVRRAVMEGPPDAPLVDDLLGQRDGGHAPVVERDHVRNPGRLHRAHHLLAFGRIHGQRLLAEDHLAGLRRRHGDLLVREVRNANVDQVDILGLDQPAPIRLGALVAPDVHELLRLLQVDIADGPQHRAVLDREEVVQPPVRVRVCAAHEAAADETDSQSSWLP